MHGLKNINTGLGHILSHSGNMCPKIVIARILQVLNNDGTQYPSFSTYVISCATVMYKMNKFVTEDI